PPAGGTRAACPPGARPAPAAPPPSTRGCSRPPRTSAAPPPRARGPRSGRAARPTPTACSRAGRSCRRASRRPRARRGATTRATGPPTRGCSPRAPGSGRSAPGRSHWAGSRICRGARGRRTSGPRRGRGAPPPTGGRPGAGGSGPRGPGPRPYATPAGPSRACRRVLRSSERRHHPREDVAARGHRVVMDHVVPRPGRPCNDVGVEVHPRRGELDLGERRLRFPHRVRGEVTEVVDRDAVELVEGVLPAQCPQVDGLADVVHLLQVPGPTAV